MKLVSFGDFVRALDNDDLIDWRLTTWDGARRETLRRWGGLPLEHVIAALEEIQHVADDLSKPFPVEKKKPDQSA